MRTDKSLCQLIRAGDREAFDCLYDRYEKPVFRFLLRYLRNAQDAEEIFHEAWIAVLRHEELKFEPGSFQAWLYQVARNLALNRLRGRKRFENVCRLLPDEEAVEVKEAEPPEGRAELVARALAKLPAPLVQVFELRAQGKSYEEMAAVLNLPVGTIKSRMHSMVRRLQSRLKR